MNYQIKLVTEGGQAFVVRTKRFWIFPIPLTKTYYCMVSYPRVLEEHRTPRWMSYQDANVTYAALKEKQRMEKALEEQRRREKRGTVMEETF